MPLRLLLLPLLLLLAACAAPEPGTGVTRALDPQLSEAHLAYSFDTCSGTMRTAEGQRIRNFLSGLRLTGADVVIVTIPKGRTPAIDAQRVQVMRGLLAGVPAQVRILAPRDLRELPRSDSNGIVRVVRVLGVGADCAPGTPGCVLTSNLAAMIAQPEDTFLPPRTGRRVLGGG